ncbi:putative MFS transporter, partial [Teratosphaeria destructans]
HHACSAEPRTDDHDSRARQHPQHIGTAQHDSHHSLERILGSLGLFLGEATNITYSAIASRTTAGLHNAPAPQFVAFLSGIIQISLPNRTDAGSVGWVVGGRYGIIYAEDTAVVSRYGHNTRYVSDESTIALAIPVADHNEPPLGQHKVLRTTGGSQLGFAVYGLILFVTSMTLEQAAVPLLLEKAICRQHYHKYGAAATDLDCKDKTVQKTLAGMFGILGFTMSALALTLALPFAWLAGRVPKTTLLLFGAVVTPIAMTLFFYIVEHPASFDVKAVVVPVILNAIGGGPVLAFTLVYSILAEAVEPDQLAITYYRIGAVVLVLQFSVRAAAASVLEVNRLWVEIAIPSLYAATIPLFLLERLKASSSSKVGQAAYVRLEDLDIDEGDDALVDESTKPAAHKDFASPDVSFYAAATDLLSFFRRLISSRLLRRCLAICFVKVLSLSVGVIELQWISSRLGIEMSTALYFGSYNTLGSAVVLVLLPYATRYFLAKLKVKQKMELHIMRLSILFRAVGQLAFALSPGPMTLVLSITIFALSSGAYDTFKSLITSFCAGTDVTRLYLVLTAVDTAASIVGSLIYPALLSIGLDYGYFGMCLPYILAASCTLVVWVMLRGLENMEGFNAVTVPTTP